jgi:predicted RNase H-like nuclease (RuvC/YqgF family)
MKFTTPDMVIRDLTKTIQELERTIEELKTENEALKKMHRFTFKFEELPIQII